MTEEKCKHETTKLQLVTILEIDYPRAKLMETDDFDVVCKCCGEIIETEAVPVVALTAAIRAIDEVNSLFESLENKV